MLIDLSDQRTLKAIEIASTAGQWLRLHTYEGRLLYGVPSQSSQGRYHVVTPSACSCPAFRLTASAPRVSGMLAHTARASTCRPCASTAPWWRRAAQLAA